MQNLSGWGNQQQSQFLSSTPMGRLMWDAHLCSFSSAGTTLYSSFPAKVCLPGRAAPLLCVATCSESGLPTHCDTSLQPWLAWRSVDVLSVLVQKCSQQGFQIRYVFLPAVAHRSYSCRGAEFRRLAIVSGEWEEECRHKQWGSL